MNVYDILERVIRGLPFTGDRATAANPSTVFFKDAFAALVAERTRIEAGLLQVASLTLTDAQIKALPSTTYELIAAPGEGQIIVPVAGFVEVNTVGAYTISGSPSLTFGWGSQMKQALSIVDTAFPLRNATRSFVNLGPVVSAPTLGDWAGYVIATPYTSDLRNLALNIADWELGPDPYTDGNPQNSLRATVWYRVVNALL